MRKLLVGALILWAVLSAFEVALIGRFDTQETPVGVAIALLATLVSLGALVASRTSYRLQLSWLWFVILVARNIVRDTFIVYGLLLRRLMGARIEDAFVDIPFEPGGDDPASAGRRALAIAGISTAPNEIAICINAENRTLRVHALVVTGGRRHSAWWPL